MIRFVLPKRGIVAGDVVFQVDVLDALGDGAAQQHQPLLLGAGATCRRRARGGR